LSLYETTALLTPSTASRLLRTMNGQSAQYIFFTASVMVFSAAKAVEEARTLTAMAAQARRLVIEISPFMSRGMAALSRPSERSRAGHSLFLIPCSKHLTAHRRTGLS